MTVSTTINRISYPGNGATTAFTFPFPAVDPGFISVFVTDPTDVSIQQSPSTFTVVLNPPMDPNPTSVGGTVTYPTVGPPLGIGFSITIIRQLPKIQEVSISNQSIIYPPVVEQEFDYLTLLGQDQQEGSDRVFRVGPLDPVPALVPTVAERASQIAFFDSEGNLTAGGTAGVVPISAAMQPVVASATLPSARTAMGVASIDSPVFTGNPQAPTKSPGDNTQSIATTAFVQAASAGATFTTGDLKPTHKTIADPGWIIWSDGTIGNATSGSSIRANADTQSLFILYYNGYSDANCPLLTGGGGATTRAAQGTAAAAFSASCRMNLPKGAGRSIGLSGAGSGLTARTLGSAVGSETETPTLAKTASHGHTFSGTTDVESVSHTHNQNNRAALTNCTAGGSTNIWQGDTTAATDGASVTHTHGFSGTTVNSGSGTPLNIMSPTTYINIMVKL